MIQKYFILVSIILLSGLTLSEWCKYGQTYQQAHIYDIDYSSDGNMFITASQSTFLTIWNSSNMNIIYTYHYGFQVKTAKFDKSQNYIAFGGSTNHVTVISAISPFGFIHNITTSNTNIAQLDFSYDSKYMVVCGSNSIHQIFQQDASNNVVTKSSQILASTSLTSCKFATNGMSASSSSNGQLHFFYSNGTLFKTKVISGHITQIDFRNGGQYVIISSLDNSIYQYNTILQSTTIRTTTTTQQYSIAYSKQSSWYAVGGADKVLKIYSSIDLNNITCIFAIKIDTSDIRSIVFNHLGTKILVGTTQGHIYQYTLDCINCLMGSFKNQSSCLLCTIYLPACIMCNNQSVCQSCLEGYYINNDACQLCSTINGCIRCKSATICSLCSQGYYLLNQNCYSCQNISQGCYSCNQLACTKCSNNYYVDNGLCVRCTTISNCLRCQLNNTCIFCRRGYYVDGGLCLSCSAHCLSCSSATVCLRCSLGYQNSTGNCTACNGCPKCDNNGCLQCYTDSYKQGNLCKNCQLPCATCTSISLCTTCISGYYLTNINSCIQCSNKCITCNSSSSCSSCSSGYYLQNNNTCKFCFNKHTGCSICTQIQCIQCQHSHYMTNTSTCQQCKTVLQGCQQCSTLSICTRCSSGYYLNSSSNQCQRCSYKCFSCGSQNICYNCIPGFYRSILSSCQQCSIGCDTCQSNIICLTCLTQYYLDIGTKQCKKCLDQIPGCLACLSQSKCLNCQSQMYITNSDSCATCTNLDCMSCNITDCFSCMPGAYLLNKNCQKCPSECISCTSPTNCSDCLANWFLDSSNQCKQCSFPCINCSSVACFTCVVGYYIENGTCNLCESSLNNCLQCYNGSQCLRCEYSYMVHNANKTCTKCYNEIQNCAQCKSSTQCQICWSGYYLDNLICKLCTIGCRQCTTNSNCTQCIDGYTLNILQCKQCTQYLKGCSICTNINQCQICLTGYYLNSNKSCQICQVAIIGCQICTNDKICLNCFDQYYLNNNQCQQCSKLISNCQTCNTINCTNCQSQHYLNQNGQCISCTQYCSECISQYNCSYCLSGYYLQNNQMCKLCSQQIQGCLFCSNNSLCQQCTSGYYLSNHLCSSCKQSGCSICDQIHPQHKCITCNTGYYLNYNNSCQLCYHTISHCLECSNQTNCLFCSDNFYLESPTECKICHQEYQGCLKCTSLQCLQCKSGYLLTNKNCTSCSSTINGCIFCIDFNNCLNCINGYYELNGLCKHCSTIQGCINCRNQKQCLHCDVSYYLNNGTCKSCQIIKGCLECINQNICLNCHSLYKLTQNNCKRITADAQLQPYQQIKLITYYINSNTLKHILFLIGLQVVQIQQNWLNETQLNLYDSDYNELTLEIHKVQWSKDGSDIIFYTNNPLTEQEIENNMHQMKLTRLLQLNSNLQLNYKSQIIINKRVIQQLLPTLSTSYDLIISYSLNNPQFKNSIISSRNYIYWIFGATIIIYMLIIYLFMELYLQQSLSSQIIPHILLIKCAVFTIYPAFVEYISYCYGFMLIDLPWFNQIFSNTLTNDFQIAPNSYLLLYNNMNIASTYLLPIIIIILLISIRFLLSKFNSNKIQFYDEIIYAIFISGLCFACSANLQGCYYNSEYITATALTSLFYVFGNTIYIIIIFHAIYYCYQNYNSLYRIRIIIKATLLSYCYISSIPMITVVITFDLLFCSIEYFLHSGQYIYGKLWVFVQILVNSSLFILIIVPELYISIIGCSILLLIALGIDLYIRISYYQLQKQIKQQQQQYKSNIIFNDGIHQTKLDFLQTLETYGNIKCIQQEKKIDYQQIQIVEEQKKISDQSNNSQKNKQEINIILSQRQEIYHKNKIKSRTKQYDDESENNQVFYLDQDEGDLNIIEERQKVYKGKEQEQEQEKQEEEKQSKQKNNKNDKNDKNDKNGEIILNLQNLSQSNSQNNSQNNSIQDKIYFEQDQQSQKKQDKKKNNNNNKL